MSTTSLVNEVGVPRYDVNGDVLLLWIVAGGWLTDKKGFAVVLDPER